MGNKSADIADHFSITIQSGNSCTYLANITRDITTEVFYSTKLVLALIGLILNLASILIFIHVKRRSVFLLLLLHLSLVEVVFNGTGVIFELLYYILIITEVPLGNPRVAQAVGYSVFFGTYLVYKAFLFARNWLIVFIAWRRYRAVRDPISTNRVLSKSFVNRVVILLHVVSLVVTIPRTLEVTYNVCEDSGQLQPKITYLMLTHFSMVYRTLFFVCTSPFPILCVVICSLSLLRVLNKRDHSVELMTTQNAQRKSSTRIVFILCGIFTFCEMPMFLAGVFNRLAEESADIKVALVGLANILTNLDSVLNFIVYYYSLACFKKAIRRFFVCRIRQRNCNRDNNGKSDVWDSNGEAGEESIRLSRKHMCRI